MKNSAKPVPKVIASSSAAFITTTMLAVLSLFGVDAKKLALVAPAVTVAVFAAGYAAPRASQNFEDHIDAINSEK